MAPSADTSGLTAFERRRAENAKANNELLSSISRTSAKVFGAAAVAAAQKKANASSSRRSRVSSSSSSAAVKHEAVPTRRSARVAGIDAEADAGLKRKFGSDGASSDPEAAAAAAAREKRLRVSGDLSLSDMKVDGRTWQSSLEGLSGLGGSGAAAAAAAGRSAQPGVRTFTEDDIHETSDATLKALRKEIGSLELYDRFEVKERIYAMAFHPSEDKPVIFAGDKEGHLGIFDASQEPDMAVKEEDAEDDEDDDPKPVILGFKPHARTITGIHVLDSDPNAVYTSSYDTTIRKLDLQQQKSVEVYAPADGSADDAAISCIDFAVDNPNTVFFSTLQGDLGRHDLRTRPGRSGTDLWPGLHGGHKIGGFSLSPQQPHLVATASLDRTVKVWDLRKIVEAEADDDDGDDGADSARRRPALLGEDASRLSVSHAAWGPGGQVATTSYDNTIKIYDLADATGKLAPGAALGTAAMKPVCSIPHNNQTGRWVTILKPQWQRRPVPSSSAARTVHKFVVGNMNRFVDVYAADGEQLGQLDGDGITAVPAVAHFHPSRTWVAGGNGSGKLTLWM